MAATRANRSGTTASAARTGPFAGPIAPLGVAVLIAVTAGSSSTVRRARFFGTAPLLTSSGPMLVGLPEVMRAEVGSLGLNHDPAPLPVAKACLALPAVSARPEVSRTSRVPAYLRALVIAKEDAYRAVGVEQRVREAVWSPERRAGRTLLCGRSPSRS